MNNTILAGQPTTSGSLQDSVQRLGESVQEYDNFIESQKPGLAASLMPLVVSLVSILGSVLLLIKLHELFPVR